MLFKKNQNCISSLLKYLLLFLLRQWRKGKRKGRRKVQKEKKIDSKIYIIPLVERHKFIFIKHLACVHVQQSVRLSYSNGRKAQFHLTFSRHNDVFNDKIRDITHNAQDTHAPNNPTSSDFSGQTYSRDHDHNKNHANIKQALLYSIILAC